MDDLSIDCEDNDNKLIRIKKTKTFGTELINKNSIVMDKRERSVNYSKRYNSSKRLLDISSHNSLGKNLKKDLADNSNIKGNKFISNSKIKVDDMKLKIANNKIKNYINNLIGGSVNCANSEREFNSGVRTISEHRRVESLRRNENRRNSKISNKLSFPSTDLKNNINSYMITVGQDEVNNKNILSVFNMKNNNNNYLSIEKNFNNFLNGPANHNLFKNNNGETNNIIGKISKSNELNENSDELNNYKKKSFTSKFNDDSESYNLKSFLQLDSNNHNKLNNNNILINSESKRPNSQIELNLHLSTIIGEKHINSNLLLLNENNNFKSNENKTINKDADLLDQIDANVNFIKLKNQISLNSVEKNFLEADNESNLRINNEKKNYFLGLHSHQKRPNINLINKKSEIDLKRNSSIVSNQAKNSKLLSNDLLAKNKLVLGSKNESQNNNNFLLNKSLTNSKIMNANKNRDLSFESENLDREILNIHLKYSNNNFGEITFKNNKKKKSKKSVALVKEDQAKKLLTKLNQMNGRNNIVNTNNQLINLNTYNINNKNEQIVNVDKNNYVYTLDSQSNLIQPNDNLRVRENSNSSRNNLYSQGNVLNNVLNGNKNPYQPIISNTLNEQNENSNNNISPITKLNQPIQINIPHNLNQTIKNYNRNFDFDVKNVRKSLKKGNFLDQEGENSENRYSSENSSQDNRSIKIYHNIYDSFSGEEWDEAKANKPDYILRPDCCLKEIVDIISTLFVFYTIIFSPYQMAFEKDGDVTDKNLIYFDIFIDLFFVVDFLLNFITAYRDDKDDLIYSLKKILKNYIKSWFIFDLVSCIPFTFINYILTLKEEEVSPSSRFTFMDSSSNLGVSKLQRFAKIAKFYRLLKWSKILRFLKIAKSDNNAKNIFGGIDGLKSSINRFIKFLIIFVFLIHFATCIWIFVASMNVSNGDPVNWITYYNFIDQSNSQIYITSLYFILVTVFSIGYGDITPKSFIEKLVSLFLLTVGCLIFSYALSSLSNIFSQIDKKKEIFNKKESILNEIKIEYRLDRLLEKKIKNSLKHDLNSWNEDRLALIESLPSILKNQLYLKMYEDKIKNLIFFDNQSYEFITLTIGYLRSVKFSKHDYIISIGEIIYEMYLTINGLIGVELGNKYQKHEICIIPKNFHFGDILMYTNQQSKLSYKVKTINSELFIMSKINFAQIKLAFDKPTSKLLEQSYEFFMKIERTRILAIRYFEKNGSFEDFKGYLKKYVNKKNMQFKSEHLGMSDENSEFSVEKQIQSDLENKRGEENETVSDIFTINSHKTIMSDIIYDQDANEADSYVSKNFNSKISNLISNERFLKDDASLKKNLLSERNKGSFKTDNPDDEICTKINLNNSNISDEDKEDKMNTNKMTNKKLRVTTDNFKEDKNNHTTEAKGKMNSMISKKKTFFLHKKEPLEQIKEDETVILKKSRTTKYVKNKADDYNVSSKIQKLITKERNRVAKQETKSYFDFSDQEGTKKNNITLNYKGFNINSMLFSPGEKKKLKFRYQTLNLDFSSSSSFFDSEKDEEKINLADQATSLKKSRTTRFEENYNNKSHKNYKLLNKNQKSSIRKKTTNDKYKLDSSYKKDLSKTNLSSESKSEKDIMIKNQLLRALTSTSKKNYNEDINNFYKFNYENNKESIKLTNFDKLFSKKSSINKKNKKSKFNNFTGNNTIKENNSVKFSDDVSKNSDYLENIKGIGEIIENKEPLAHNALTDMNNKENINNNIRSDISFMNSHNSKNIIYINNLNINYSNRNVNPIENLNNPGRFNLRDNNFVIGNNDREISKSEIFSREQRFNFNNINKIVNNNTFLNEDSEVQREFNTKQQSDSDNYKKLNNFTYKKINNFQNEIQNSNLTKPYQQLENNPNQSNYDKDIIDANKREKQKISNYYNKEIKSHKIHLKKELDENTKRISQIKNRNYDNKDYYSDNQNIIKNPDFSGSYIRFKNVKINSTPKKKIKLDFHSETESKTRRCNKPSFDISCSSKKKEQNPYLNRSNNINFYDEANKINSTSACKNLHYTKHNTIRNPNMINHYHESHSNYFNKNEENKKNITVTNKKSKTTKINTKNNPKLIISKSIYDTNRGTNFYSGFNLPMDTYGGNHNDKNIHNNYNNLRTNSNHNSNHLNPTMSKPQNHNKITSDTNISNNKTMKQYKTFFDGKPSLTVKRSAKEVNFKSSLNQNHNSNNYLNSNNSNSVSQLKFLKKKTFLEIPNNMNQNKEHDFLKILSNKITYDAFLYKNKEVLQNCIKDFLDDIQGESRFKHIMNRLNNLELLVKEYVKSSNGIVNNRGKISKKMTEKL